MISDFSQSLIDRIKPVRVACPVTKELYGYAESVVDVEATMRKFIEEYRTAKQIFGVFGFDKQIPGEEELCAIYEYYQSL